MFSPSTTKNPSLIHASVEFTSEVCVDMKRRGKGLRVLIITVAEYLGGVLADMHDALEVLLLPPFFPHS